MLDEIFVPISKALGCLYGALELWQQFLSRLAVNWTAPKIVVASILFPKCSLSFRIHEFRTALPRRYRVCVLVLHNLGSTSSQRKCHRRHFPNWRQPLRSMLEFFDFCSRATRSERRPVLESSDTACSTNQNRPVQHCTQSCEHHTNNRTMLTDWLVFFPAVELQI